MLFLLIFTHLGSAKYRAIVFLWVLPHKCSGLGQHSSQLSYCFPAGYKGLDILQQAIDSCRQRDGEEGQWHGLPNPIVRYREPSAKFALQWFLSGGISGFNLSNTVGFLVDVVLTNLKLAQPESSSPKVTGLRSWQETKSFPVHPHLKEVMYADL